MLACESSEGSLDCNCPFMHYCLLIFFWGGGGGGCKVCSVSVIPLVSFTLIKTIYI